jgi:hypothetical protein
MIVLYYIYYVQRMRLKDDVVVPHIDDISANMVFYMVMHTSIIIIATIIMLDFISVNEKSTKFFILIKKCVNDIIPFLTFFTIFLLITSLLFTVSGVDLMDPNDNDYPEIARTIATLLQNFRNGLGDISPPNFDMWTKYEKS